jgi:hypothetical protein
LQHVLHGVATDLVERRQHPIARASGLALGIAGLALAEGFASLLSR